MTTQENIDVPLDASKWNGIDRYVEDLPPLSDVAQKLLVEYSKVPQDEVTTHVKKIRDEAFRIHPYPCIGRFHFLNFSLSSSPSYTHILSRLREPGTTFLDLGCCFGQEIRQLAAEGIPHDRLYGAELQPAFVDLGYELFRDRDTLKAKILAPANVFEDEPLGQLEGQIDVVHAGSFFHLFGYEQQVAVAKRVMKLLRQKKGSILVGRQVGNVNPKEYVGPQREKSRFWHNAESWKRMWEEVGQATDSKWNVEVTLVGVEETGPQASWGAEVAGRLNASKGKGQRDAETEGMRRLSFTITRE